MSNVAADRISTLLKTQKISVEELANASQKHPSSLYRILNGESRPTKATLKAISTATGASLNWLINGTGDMMDPDKPKPPAASVSTSDISRALDLLREQLAKKDEQIEMALKALAGRVNFPEPSQNPDSAVVIPIRTNRAESVRAAS